MTTLSTTPEDLALKARHRALWALGNYPAVAAEVIGDLGEVLVAATGIVKGERVLDVAAGSGNASLPAARRGAVVTASDLTPELLAAGRGLAEREGLDLRWETADAEALPYETASFDATISCVGVMFAPHHDVAAAELVRVTRPGGRIGLLAWTPEGFIGQLFATMKPYAPPPPPGAQPPPLWGRADHVRQMLGDAVRDVVVRQQVLHVDRFASGVAFRDYFKENYGPVIAVVTSLADDPERADRLDAELAALGDRFADGDGATGWEYLLVTATRV